MRSMNTVTTDVRQHILDAAKPLILGRGFTAVGLTELLAVAQVPKGSFYHYFDSKEGFGEALLGQYFSGFLEHLSALLSRPGTGAERLMAFWEYWLATQVSDNPADRCLVVKLGAEVCDLSERMRIVLEQGTRRIMERLAQCIETGKADGSLPIPDDPAELATRLYQAWLGASLLSKITRSRAPLDNAMTSTRRLLGLSATAD